MFVLGIRYLTGYAVATDVADRERAEWPPHPARVFMALAAAHFETGEDPSERAAMRWIEGQAPPAIKAEGAFLREVVRHYVPVNDPILPRRIKEDAKPETVSAALAVLPQRRPRQPRTFPRVRPHEDTVYLVWAEAHPAKEHRAAMDRLCKKVIRIGHSSSLVQMWVEGSAPEPNWSPADTGELRLRIAGEGTLSYLESQFNAKAVCAYADLQERIASAKDRKEKGRLKKELAERFGDVEPTTRRPTIGLWQSYRRDVGSIEEAHPASGPFHRDMMILALQDGPVVGLETTWQLLTALRDAILSLCDPTPEWVSGHRADGSPSQEPHLALLPLAFVGHPHADGHLLGVGLGFPRNVPPRQRGAALARLLYDASGRPKPLELRVGSLGAWSLVRETRESPPMALQAQVWTGPSRSWATVTPIVLDRHPKADYGKQRARWVQEVSGIIAESCRRQGLPEPLDIDVGKTCWHRGAPRAIPGKGGFALIPTKTGQLARQQVHAWLRFDQDVEGPLLLGAGRYRGYGVCKPWNGAAR